MLKLSSEFLKIAKEVGRIADQKNISAYLVGGVVRDLLLRRVNHDLDFVIEGDAVEFARALASRNGLKVTAYQQFKTATIFWKKDLEVDFVTSRKETYEYSGALPKVDAGNLKDDLFRRDFTVNALALSVNAESFGHLIDFYNGIEDLKKKKIRILHAKSFIDDPTRILRAVRFAVRLGFAIEDQTLRLLKQAVRNEVLSNVKIPRLFQEFKKNLCEKDLVSQVQVLDQLRILKEIHPDVNPDFKLLFAVEDYVKKNRTHGSSNQWLFALMVLVSRFKSEQAKKFLTDIQINKETEECILQSLSLKEVLAALNKPLLKPSKIYMILRSFRIETVTYFALQAITTSQKKNLKRYLEKDIKCRLESDGNDVKKLGFLEGKRIKEVLEEVLFNKLDGKIKSKTEELQFARSLLS